MRGYVFISNSTKPTPEKAKSREPIHMSNVGVPCMEAALDMGFDIYWGINRENPEEIDIGYPVHKFDAHSYRSLTAFSDNKIAYKNLCEVMKNANIDAMHCNTPIGGMIGRLCARKFKTRKVIYTAHGFHFFKGAPLFNRTILKWAEMFMARYTDAIITMNREDYEAAKRFKLRKGGKVYFVHGVGITLSEFEGVSACRDEKRQELNLAEDDIALISMGDLVARKNYAVSIRAIAKAQNKKLHYFICGRGPDLESLEALAKELGVENQVHFLGFRTDVKQLLAACDIFLFTTLQEGLPRSMMEAMATGLPCVASSIRGNVDLMNDGEGGFLRPSCDVDGFAEAINKIANDAELRGKMREFNLEKIKEFDISVVRQEIRDIYKEVYGE